MAILTREEYNKLKKQSENSVSKSSIMTKAEYDKLDKTQLFSGSVLEQYNESLTKGTKNTSNKNNGLLSAFNDGYDFGDITKTLWKGAKQLSSAMDTTRRELMLNPVQTAKTAVVSTAHGVNKASNSINNALSDFSNWIMGRDKKYHLSFDELNKLQKIGTTEEKQNVLKKYLQEYGENSSEYQLAHQILNTPDNRSDFVKAIDNVVNKKYYDTDTYKNYASGNMPVGQKNIWNIGENIGNMLPSMAVSTVTGVPVLGSAVFFTQAQQNYTEEAKTRGYEDKDARTYGLIMGGLESLVERLGFDQLGGLKKMSQGNLLKSMAGEGLEEFVMPYIDSTIKSVGYNEKFDLQGTTEEAIKSAVSGAIIGGIMNLGGQGFQQVDSVVNKINNNQDVTSDDILEAVEEIQEANPEYFDEIIEDLPKVLDDKTITEIQEKINQKEVVDKKILPTVEDIVVQEQNSNANEKTTSSKQLDRINDTIEQIDNIDSDMNFVTKNIQNNDILKYTTKEIEKFSNGKVRIANNFNDVISFVESAKKIPSNAKLYFGKISKQVANKINNQLGINLENYNLSLKADSIKHILKKHSSEKELKRGQVPITETDFALIPEIVSNYDSIEQSGKTEQGKPALTFTKQIGDTYYLVNYVSDKNHTLEVQTMYKHKKKNSATADNTSSPIQTSETNSSTSSSYGNNNITISQNSQIASLPNTSNMQNNQDNSINMPPVENNTTQKEVNNNQPSKIAEILNETIKGDSLDVKQRKWIETSLESEVVKDKVLLQDLDVNKINYVVQSNKKTLDKANSKLKSMGYETSVEYIKSKINDNDISLTDIALAERLVQEAIKKGDMQLASDLIMDTAILGTDLGQKVQALSMIQRLTPEGQLKFFQKLVQRAKAKGDKSFQNVEITPEMVDLILNAYKADGTFDQNDLNDRVEQFKKKVAEQLVTTKSEKIVAWRYLSMLGNAKTHIRNIVSNIAMWGTLKVKNATARTLETLLPVKNRTKTWKKASQEVSNYAKQVTQEMKGVITGENKYNEKTSIESKKQIFKNKALEKIKDFNSNMLTNEDWLFSRTAFENTFKEYLTAQGIETKADIDNNSKIIEKAKLYALEQAEIATFRQYSWLANQISKIENKNFATKLVIGSTIPFKKTPINIAKTGASYSPLGLLKTVSYDAYQVSKGNMEASQFIDNLSQGITGTSLTLIGYALAKAGLLKGAGDDDKEGKYDSYLGNQSYSIKIGDSTYSISWLSPVAMPLLVGATAYEKLEEQSEWDMNVIIDTLAQTLDPLSEMSFLSSLDDVLSSYDSGIKKFAGMAGSMAQNYITQFIPTLFSQIASTLDNKKRTTRASNNSSWKFGEETIRKIMYKIPIARNQLEVSTDIWGNEIEQSDNIIERAFENFIAPYTRKKDISTGLDYELKRLYNATGETGVIPGVPKAFIKYEDVTYQLSADEYTRLKKTYGTIANEYLHSLVKNKNYKTATDEEKANMVKEIFEYSSAISKEEYFKDKDIKYTTDILTKVNKLRELGMSTNQLTEYVSNQKVISTIRNNQSLTTQDKKSKISDLLVDADLTDKQLAFLYSSYYSSEKTLNSLLNVNIPIKEFIKFNSQEFTTDYYTNGKAITNSRKNKIIKYVNSMKLSIPEKAILIKMEYNSYDNYNSQIVSYINKMNYSKFEKASLLKSFGFDNYDKYLINQVNSQNISIEEKAKILENLGFTIRNGRVYS